MKNKLYSFEEIFEQNKRRIHYQIHKLNIHDKEEDYFQEGLIALWNAYEKHHPDKGPMATYFNYTIRHRLIDHIRKESRVSHNEDQLIQQKRINYGSGNAMIRHGDSYPISDIYDIAINDQELWNKLKNNLTNNQWTWVEYFVIKELPVKEIAYLENKSEDAVKSWGKQVRKKLRSQHFRNTIGLDINN